MRLLGAGRGPALRVGGDGLRVRLEGLTLLGGLAERGGGLELEGNLDLALVDCALRENQARVAGGGIWAAAGRIWLLRCSLAENAAPLGGGICLAGSARLELRACTLHANTARSGGGLALQGDARCAASASRWLENRGEAGGDALHCGPGWPKATFERCLLVGRPERSSFAAQDLPVSWQPLQANDSLLPPDLYLSPRLLRGPGLRGDAPVWLPPPAPLGTLDPAAPGQWALAQALAASCAPAPGPTPLESEIAGPSAPAGVSMPPLVPAAAPSAAAAPSWPADPGLRTAFAAVPLRLQRYLASHWFRAARSSGQLSDLFVSLEEVFLRLRGGAGEAGPAVPPLIDLPSLAELDAQLTALGLEARAAAAARAAAGSPSPLEQLQHTFGLSDLALDLVATLAGLQSDLSLYRVAAFAWGDPSLRQPSLGFLLDLVAPDPAARAEAWACLRPGGPLLRWGLLQLGELEGFAPRTPELFRPVALPDRVLRHLLGDPTPDAALPADALRPLTAPGTLDELPLEEGLVARLPPPGLLAPGQPLVLVAEPGTGRASLLTAWAAAGGRALWQLALDRLDPDPALRRDQVRLGLREILLAGALPLLRLDQDLDLVPEREQSLRLSFAPTQDLAGLGRGFALCCRRENLGPVLEQLSGARVVDLARPGLALQRQQWELLLRRRGWALEPGEIAALVAAYDLLPAGMQSALDNLSEEDSRSPSRAQLVAAVRRGIRHQLAALADPVHTTLRWDDAILSEELRLTLSEVLAYARQRDKVFGTWGFGRKAGGHFGLSVLFAGPPGTGKTMTACLLGLDLGREVYRVDLSRVVNKYIGETEKNLGRLFDEAEKAQVILLFDEADSLFSKRTEVKSSNDRYANLEVNYLLQRMEAYSGMSILTTNFDLGLDAAFQRRLRFRVSFRMPQAADRERLWRSMVPPEAEAAPDIDWSILAEEFEMAGGNIKNAVIRAAVLSAERGERIGFDALYDAALAEYREMGRLA